MSNINEKRMKNMETRACSTGPLALPNNVEIICLEMKCNLSLKATLTVNAIKTRYLVIFEINPLPFVATAMYINPNSTAQSINLSFPEVAPLFMRRKISEIAIGKLSINVFHSVFL